MRLNLKAYLLFAFLFYSYFLSAQSNHSDLAQIQKVIHGKVLDSATKAPVSGATILVSGTNHRVLSNSEGQFELKIEKELPVEVKISLIGYKSIVTKITDDNAIIPLVQEVNTLSDIVVVGYGTQKKSKVTGAISTIKMDDVLGDRPVSTTSALLQNAIPGLQVSITSGQPGASSNINVRGGTDFGSSANSSINTGSPFILVDNIPFNGPLNMLDPSDIESVTVLKDAGSAAIYGARSAFGVILVTTKSGKKNQKPQIDYSNNISFASPMVLPQRATPLQQVQSWIDGGNTSTYWGSQNLQTWVRLLTDYKSNPSNYPNGYAIQNGVYYQLKPIDETHELLGNTSTQQLHNISVAGGSDKITYRISFGSTDEKGIIVPEANQDAYKRYTAKSFITSDITSWLNVQLDANYFYSLTTSPYNSTAFATATVTPSVLPDSLPAGQGLSLSGPITTAKNTLLNQYPTKNRYDDIRMTGRAILKPAKGLTITSEYTYDNLRNGISSYDKFSNNLISTYTLTLASSGTGMYTLNNANTDYQALNIFANYNKTIARDHSLDFVVGFNQETSDYSSQTLSATGMYNVNQPAIATATGTITGSDKYDQYATRGVFGRINYDYKSKYLLQFNWRHDGTSKFPENHRWGSFPSVSAGWRAIEESFLKPLQPWLSDLKLRGSLGTVGNQNINDYAYYSTMNAYSPYWIVGGIPVLSLTTPGLVSSAFTWETVKTIDGGIDFGFIKNKLTGSFDWYQRDTKGILTTAPTPLPAVLGTVAPLQNSGALRTRGFEISLNYKDKIGKVSYNIGFNLYNYVSIVTNAVNPNKTLSNLYTGEKMGDLWGYVTDRLYTVDDFTAPAAGWEAAGYAGGKLKAGIPALNGESPNPGDVLFKKFDTTRSYISAGAGTLSDPGDQKIIGNTNPQYQFGLNGSVSYSNFDFSFVIGGTLKQDLWLVNGLTVPNYWQSYSQLYANETNYWTPTHTDAYYGRIYYQNGNQSYNQNTVQSRYLLNGAYVRVKNLTLQYTVPLALLQKAHINRLRIFCSVENPFEFDHLPKGVYPDVANLGGSGGGLGYPFMRKTSVGVNLSL